MRYDELTEKSNFEWQHGTFPLPQDGAGFTSDDDDDDDTIDDNRDSDSGSQEQGHAGGEKRTQRRNVIKNDTIILYNYGKRDDITYNVEYQCIEE